MKHLLFLLEEASAQALLESVLPKLLPPTVTYRFIVFEGKQDLEKRIEQKLRGYLVPNARFIILRDQDAGDCREIKSNLLSKCKAAQKNDAIVRIACRELESWYLADLQTVDQAFNLGGKLAMYQNKQKFRQPDKLANPSVELQKLVPQYQKVGGSRQIGKYLNLDNQRSRSFYHFITAIKKLQD